jgi:hypothetical protein
VQVKASKQVLISMSKDIFPISGCEVIKNEQAREISLFVHNLRNGIWFFGIPSWLFGITDRTLASFADGYLSTLELIQLFTASFFFLSWIYLKPEVGLNGADEGTLTYQFDINPHQLEAYKGIVANRMLQLQEQHMIRQEYILPFPYLCQIYHLLNLKHLETIHAFSLNNLRVIKVSNFQPTTSGGIIKFQTVLDSPVNPLRIWRKPIVEVQLMLHTPYTVELSIPVYNNKHITVLFNAFPINNEQHKLFIDIYTNLEWHKPLLKLILHFASSLTLFEDLPYLRKLAEKNIHRIVNLSKTSNHETMWLMRRFAHLYGSSQEPAQISHEGIVEVAGEAGEVEEARGEIIGY